MSNFNGFINEFKQAAFSFLLNIAKYCNPEETVLFDRLLNEPFQKDNIVTLINSLRFTTKLFYFNEERVMDGGVYVTRDSFYNKLGIILTLDATQNHASQALLTNLEETINFLAELQQYLVTQKKYVINWEKDKFLEMLRAIRFPSMSPQAGAASSNTMGKAPSVLQNPYPALPTPANATISSSSPRPTAANNTANRELPPSNLSPATSAPVLQGAWAKPLRPLVGPNTSVSTPVVSSGQPSTAPASSVGQPPIANQPTKGARRGQPVAVQGARSGGPSARPKLK